MSGQYRARIELPKINDPVFEKEPPPPKVLKKGEKVEEEPKKEEEEFDYSYLLKGARTVTFIPLHYNLPQLYRTGVTMIPAPVYPDPDTLPVTEPIFQQLVYRVKRPQMSLDGKPLPPVTQPSIQQSNSPRPRAGVVPLNAPLSVSQLEKVS